ncbi:MAG: potassium-transporting ATPase subunit C, partial [Candidatus Margulisiibacteriota bacterium]
MKQIIYRAVMATLIFAFITGIAYPLAVTGMAQFIFKEKANGTLILKEGRIIGSKLIGQNFSRPEYFHPRPSAAGENGYDAASS